MKNRNSQKHFNIPESLSRNITAVKIICRLKDEKTLGRNFLEN